MNKSIWSSIVLMGFASIIGGTQASAENTTLQPAQEETLVFIYQEEKMARDVYTALNERWDMQIFSNIQRSEQRHMDAVRSLLETYNIPVPIIEDKPGIFEDSSIQELYDILVEQGSVSKEAALEVGVFIEETDIVDIEAHKDNATTEMQKVFDNLLRGSRNHLQAFTRTLEKTQEQSDDTSQKRSKEKSEKKRHSRNQRRSR